MTHRVLFIDHASAIGGAERSLLLLARHLPQDRWQVHVACGEGALAVAVRDLPVSCHPVDLPRLRGVGRILVGGPRGILRIAKLVRRLKPDVIHANTVRAALYAAPVARLTRRPLVWHMRDFWLSEEPSVHIRRDEFVKRALLGAATRVVTNSRATAAHLPDSEKVCTVLNGIDFDRFDPKDRGIDFKRSYDIPDGAAVVGTVGRVRPWKGQARFLDMAVHISERDPAVRFLVVGGDPFRADSDALEPLRQRMLELGLQDRVTFTGHLDDVRPALASMAIFVHPGDPEPFGLVNVEAMAMGKPVVGLDHGALPEIVVSGETGVLVSPDVEIGLAVAVLGLLADTNRAERMGEEGRRRVTSHFSIGRTTAEIEEILQAIVSPRSTI